MDKIQLKQEQNYLDNVRACVVEKIKNNEDKILTINKELLEIYNSISEETKNRISADGRGVKLSIERTIELQKLNQMESQKDFLQNDNKKIQRIADNPFFAKIEFTAVKTNQKHVYYIGARNVSQEQTTVVVDWRAPVSSLFYLTELGKNSYVANEQVIDVNLTKKRQFKIEHGMIEYYIDTNAKIDDEILQRELSQNTTDFMKNIVQTIQAEQDEIIRQPLHKSLIVNGVAGSGKTSIAMHRIAYLLFANKNAVENKNFIVVSPNEAFSKYIGELLPELGEDEVDCKTFLQLCSQHVNGLEAFENKDEMFEDCLGGNGARIEAVKTMFGMDYLQKALDFIDGKNNVNFLPTIKIKTLVFDKETEEHKIKHFVINKELLAPLYFKSSDGFNIDRSIKITVERVIEKHFPKYSQTKKIKMTEQMDGLFRNCFSATQMLEQFVLKQGLTFKNSQGKILFEHMPVYCLFYLLINGVKPNYDVKYLYVDEMQDYDAVSLYVLKSIFNSCVSTIVGDFNQGLLFANNNAEMLKHFFPTNSAFELKTSYRSTYEIINFAYKILGKTFAGKKVRSGAEVKVQNCTNENIYQNIDQEIKRLKDLGNQRIAVVCKTLKQTKQVCKKIQNVIVTTAFLSKGLEYDAVIIFDANNQNYKTESDRQCLFVAATRALHNLSVTYVDEKTKFIE